MNPHVFGLYGDEMKEFRMALDETIRQIAVTMTEKDMEDGVVNAKIKIHIGRTQGADGEVVTVMKIEPSVGMRIGTSGKYALKEENGIFLQFNDNGTPVVGDHQMEIGEYIRAMAEDDECSA